MIMGQLLQPEMDGGRGEDAPAFGRRDPIEAVQETAEAESGAVIGFGCRLGGHCWSARGRRITTDAAGECGVQVLQE
jgi:hypothetical protein